MKDFRKKEEEEFSDNLWKKLEFHKGLAKPKNPGINSGESNKIQEEVILPFAKHKNNKKKTAIVCLVVFFLIVFLLLLINFYFKKEHISEKTSAFQMFIPQDYSAYWKFESGGEDETGNNSGAFKGGAVIFSDILRGQVLMLDGKKSFVEAGDKASLENQEQITVSLWMKSEEGSQTLVSKELIWKLSLEDYRLKFFTGDDWISPLPS